jgi:hypothetical protein
VKKRGLSLIIVIILFLLPSILAVSVDSEIKKLTTSAGEYESGNINYVQLLVYSSAVREKMNEILGATNKEAGGVVKEDQLKSILGNPTEETRWVWSESEQREMKMDKDVPVWKKIVFDGKKIQVRLTAWPSIFGRKQYEGDKDKKNEELINLEGKLIYRLNFEIEFKKPGEQLDIQSKIEKIKTLAQEFSSNPSSENAENLAKESVNAEKSFQSFFKQSGEKCEEVMSSIFGTENKRRTQKMYVVEATICEGENYEVVGRLEMCDDCENSWVNVDFRLEGRGPGFNMKEGEIKSQPSESSKDMETSQYQEQISQLVDEIRQSCNNKEFQAIMNARSKIWSLNEAWNQKSNDVWKDLDQIYNAKRESMTQEQRQKFDQNYGWIKLEQEKREQAKSLMKANYESRKQFFLSLFSSYEKKESYYTQIEFEKRLLEEFREKGKEICDNNQDDNENQAIDCSDEQCGGKVCGKGTASILIGNTTAEQEVAYYCIENECKAREEIQEVVRNVSTLCQELPVIQCEEGNKAFFSKYDNEGNCPLETSCLKDTETCSTNEECIQPACGIAECINNKCEVTELTECREQECLDGEEKLCELTGNVVELCKNGFWQKTGECSQLAEIREEVAVANECLVASDCGGDNVCNNGKCELLPTLATEETTNAIEGQTIILQSETPSEETENKETEQTTEETQEQIPEQIETVQEETTAENPATEANPTGNIIFNSIVAFFSRLTILGAVITGFETEVVSPEQQDSSSVGQQTETQETTAENPIEVVNTIETPDTTNEDEQRNQEEDRRNEEDDKRGEEDQRRTEENKQRCEKDCERPCVENCIKESCGENFNCVVEESQKKCEETCDPEETCIEKCMKGGDWWKEFENNDKNKQEKGVFQVGGSCRTSQGKTEGFIWFGGWGEPFQKIQYLKDKYYSGGQTEWCKYDYDNLIKQREEFEKGFNQEFVTWFFEKYLSNSAEDWEQASSGIFEIYWKDVNNARELAYRMQCLGKDELPTVNLINVKYESEYGMVEFWEEIKTVKLEGMNKEVQIITPYMKAWIFPNKEFIEYEMEKAMKNHEFPGSSQDKTERKNEEGLKAEEIEFIKQNKPFINQIKSIAEKYNGNLDAVVRLVDGDKVVFNLYVQVNENDIFKVMPMLPEEVPEQDVTIDIEFQKIYDLIYMQEKEMTDERVESPDWDKKAQPIQKIKEFAKGIQIFFKIRDIINSAEISPEASKKDVKNLMNSFIQMMMSSQGKDKSQEDNTQKDAENKGAEQEKTAMIGNVIFG